MPIYKDDEFTTGGLFIGPVNEMKIRDWILFLGINDGQTIASQLGMTGKSRKRVLSSYEESDQIDKDLEKLDEFLDKWGMYLVCSEIFKPFMFKIGYKISTYTLEVSKNDFNRADNVWPHYGITDYHIFGGIIGRIEFEYYDPTYSGSDSDSDSDSEPDSDSDYGSE